MNRRVVSKIWGFWWTRILFRWFEYQNLMAVFELLGGHTLAGFPTFWRVFNDYFNYSAGWNEGEWRRKLLVQNWQFKFDSFPENTVQKRWFKFINSWESDHFPPFWKPCIYSAHRFKMFWNVKTRIFEQQISWTVRTSTVLEWRSRTGVLERSCMATY